MMNGEMMKKKKRMETYYELIIIVWVMMGLIGGIIKRARPGVVRGRK